ncbi:hypothetical protein ACOME3_000337 [Neoechinorhynchus agilis]
MTHQDPRFPPGPDVYLRPIRHQFGPRIQSNQQSYRFHGMFNDQQYAPPLNSYYAPRSWEQQRPALNQRISVQRRRRIPHEFLKHVGGQCALVVVVADFYRLNLESSFRHQEVGPLHPPGLTLAESTSSVDRRRHHHHHHHHNHYHHRRRSPTKNKKRAYRDLDAPTVPDEVSIIDQHVIDDYHHHHHHYQQQQQQQQQQQTHRYNRNDDLDFESLIREELDRVDCDGGGKRRALGDPIQPEPQGEEDHASLINEYNAIIERMKMRHGLIPVEDILRDERVFVSLIDLEEDDDEVSSEFRGRMRNEYADVVKRVQRSVVARPVSNFVNTTSLIKHMIYRYMATKEHEAMCCVTIQSSEHLVEHPEVKKRLEALKKISCNTQVDEYRTAYNDLLKCLGKLRTNEIKEETLQQPAPIQQDFPNNWVFQQQQQQNLYAAAFNALNTISLPSFGFGGGGQQQSSNALIAQMFNNEQQQQSQNEQ